MKFVFFTHSLRSDWNHGNAHFLRGVAVELQQRGHEVVLAEPENAWSVQNLIADRGAEAVSAYRKVYPTLDCSVYNPNDLDLGAILDGASVVIVHEWNDHDLVARVGAHHARHPGYRLFFHDTHHRGATDPEAMGAYDLSGYDGVLAFGRVIRDLYLHRGWTRRAWTWHEAADIRVFYPRRLTANNASGENAESTQPRAQNTETTISPSLSLPLSPSSSAGDDLIWVGNWGDDERAAELEEFLIGPVRELGLRATIYGVRYPENALAALEGAGIRYAGSLPNYEVPDVFARGRVTVHVPRRPYAQALPGIPTIRVFEALACGIPLVSAPWSDSEGLFAPGKDFLVARNGAEMTAHLRRLLDDPELASTLACHGLATIRARHTCAHRVDQLLDICAGLEAPAT